VVITILTAVALVGVEPSWFEGKQWTLSTTTSRRVSSSKGPSTTKGRATPPKKGQRVAKKEHNKDEVAMTEYHFEGLNATVQMKQNWWHAHEPAAGVTAKGMPAPTWEVTVNLDSHRCASQ